MSYGNSPLHSLLCSSTSLFSGRVAPCLRFPGPCTLTKVFPLSDL